MLRFLRTTAAVILGYIIFAGAAVSLFRLAARNPHAAQPLWFMAIAVLSGMAFAALGALAAGVLGAHRPHVYIALALLIAAGAVGSMLSSPPADSTWSQWAALLFMAPSAYLAGRAQQARAAS
jgi:hypothetical protein